MTSRGLRKSAEQRRAEIVDAAGALALGEGLESLTLRRVADALGVVPGLVNHYFPAVDDLVAEAFGTAATAEIDEVFAAVEAGADPLERLRLLIGLLVEADRDRVSVLWLDAWQAAQRKPALHAEVSRLMLDWRDRLATIVGSGLDTGAFTAADPRAAAVRILAVVDGLSVQAVMRSDPAPVRELVVATAEREVGLPPGALRRTAAGGHRSG